MEQTLAWPRFFARRSLTQLSNVHLASLLGLALSFVYLQVLLVGEYLPIPSVLLGITVLIIAIVAMGWRWTPALGTLWIVLVMATSASVTAYHLARPENTHDFAFYVVVLGITTIGIVTGVAAIVQNYATPSERRAPRWLPMLLVAVAMLCIGAMAVVLIPRPAAASVSPKVLSDLPALTTAHFAFDRAEIRATIGETVALRLENSDTATHAFAIPELGVDVPMHNGEASLALFRPTAPGTYTFLCSVPHHESMRGVLIVTP